MWKVNDRGPAPSLSVEGLEDRRMMSASHANAVWDDADDFAAPAKRAAAAAVMMPATVSSAKAAATKTLGNWKGTTRTATTGGTITAVSMKLSTPLNSAVIGSFKLGPVTGGKALTSTAVLSNSHGFAVIFQGKGFYGSLNGTISADGKQILGRWSFNGQGGWKVGTLTLKKV
jgi:hypothetical protein